MNFDPYTGKPLRRSPWRRFRGKPWWVQALGWTGAALVMLIVIGGITGGKKQPATAAATPPTAQASTTSPTKPHHLYHGRVAGSMHLNPYDSLNSDAQAMHKLSWSRISCAWRGGHVWVSGRFRNPLAASIAVTVGPTYRLKNAGQHGDGSSTGFTVHVSAKSMRAWLGDAGAPAGVVGTPRITACIPEIDGVSLG